MRPLVVCLWIIVCAAGPAPLRAQPAANAGEEQSGATEFARLYERWRETQDAEARITLGEEALALEPVLKSWPLQTSRERTAGELWFGVGRAYDFRSQGERADNLEKAISAYHVALTYFKRAVFPYDWAKTQYALGFAYGGRIRGKSADNVDSAVAHYEAAGSVLTRDQHPNEWAHLQNSLCLGYWMRIRGERADNMDKAIAACESALTVFSRDEPYRWEWAMAQSNLGLAYGNRIRGKRADNLEKAIAAYEAVLSVVTLESDRHSWLTAQSNLANAYQVRINGEHADNIEKAIAGYEAVLQVVAPKTDGFQWGLTQNDLASAYMDRIYGGRADNLEKALAASASVLTVYTQESGIWAHAQANVGAIYAKRIRGGRKDNLEKAIAAYEQALKVQTREASPREHLRISRRLGEALLEAKEWRKAGLAYASAREAFLLLFGQGLDDAEARDLIADAGPLFGESAFAAAQRGESDAALTLASEGRARLMAVALRLQMLDLTPAKRERLDELRAAIRAEERVIETRRAAERATAVEKLVLLREELLGLVTQATAGESAPGLALAQARAVIATDGALVVPILTKLGGKILIVTAAATGQSLTVLDLPELTTNRLDELIRGGKTGGWIGAYNIHYLQGAERSRRWAEWLAAVGDLGPELWRLFAGRVDNALKARGVKTGARLVWLPTGALGILPLGLAQDPATKRRLADDYVIVYAPSLQALVSARDQIATPKPATLAAIVNPTGDLPGTEKEGNLVASYFPEKNRTVLEQAAATPESVLIALKGKTHWHFASHGMFSWEDARESGLIMHGRVALSVGSLLRADGLGHPRLVVLSACETGLYDIGNSPDEFIGLPGTFTALGASAVVGTLWPVSDAATALLMAKFYELYMGKQVPPQAR